MKFLFYFSSSGLRKCKSIQQENKIILLNLLADSFSCFYENTTYYITSECLDIYTKYQANQ